MKEKNKYGQYFTERVIAEYMVSLITHEKDCSVLEPSCGQGVFLSCLHDKGYTNTCAYEIDNTLAKNFQEVRYESFISVPTEQKYDVIIGNPPFIRWKNLEEELKNELATSVLWNRYFNSLCDYLFIFILKSIEHLDEGGELVFICSDYWINSTHAASLRNYMVTHGYFDKIYHFKEAPLFEKVNASFIIFRYVKGSKPIEKPITLYTYTEKGKPELEDLESLRCFHCEAIPHFQQNERWILATSELQNELKWFESICIKTNNLFENELCRVGDICDIGNGMVSGLDAAFKIDKEHLATLNERERNSTIHVLKAKGLGRFRFSDDSVYIFVNENIDETEFKAKYPHFEAQLSPYREELLKRYSYGRDLPYWEFAFPRSRALFERPEEKIFVPCKERISYKDYYRFCYAPQGYYPLQDVTAIVRKKGCRESIEYILAFLNSKYVFDWLRFNGIVKGEIVEFSEHPIASIPFRRIDWNNEREVALHKDITLEIQRLIKSDGAFSETNVEKYINMLFYGKNNRIQEIA